MNEPAPLLSIDELSFGYPGIPLFHRWSHDFGPGLTWVRGENGCGKSTLLQLIGGAVDPHDGVVRCGAIDSRHDPLAYRREVYWCGPDGVAFDHLRPPEFFGFIAGLYPRFDVGLAERWVQRFALAPFLKRRISELSTGTRRKVAVVAAMAAGTAVVVLDEPLSGLDQVSLHAMRTSFAEAAAQRERIWIVASHEPLGDGTAVAMLDLPRRV